MEKEPIWLREDVVLAIHKRQLAEHGGLEGVRDEGVFLSAMSKPKNLFAYSTDVSIPRLAASYAFGLARNHAFIDGNKRTAYVACRMFLKLNGFDLKASELEKYETFMKLAAGDLTEDQLASWLMANSVES